MRPTNDRIIYQRSDGSWANQRVGSARAGSLHPTQRDAASAARGMLIRAGGGELMIKGENGRIRSKDTIGGGNDPRSIRDLEH